ncbi:HotDog domain-containing protein [Phycomyces blakesleeanus]
MAEQTMSHSFLVKYIPFKSSVRCYEEYVSFNKKIRIGRLLEDIDDIGGAIAARHIERMGPSDICANFTVGMEQTYMNIPDTIEDYKLTGHIAYTKDSLLIGVITLEVVKDEQIPDNAGIFHPSNIPSLGVSNPNAVAEFSVVSIHIDSFTKKAIPVVQLKLTTFHEQWLFDKTGSIHDSRREIVKKRRDRQKIHLDNNHIFRSISTRDIGKGVIDDRLTSGGVSISDTRIENNATTTPQQMNGNGTIFGGYIMRDAFELATTEAALFLLSPEFETLKINDISFLSPILTGDHIRTSARVIYSNSPLSGDFVVRVEVDKRSIESSDYKPAVIMHISFVSVSQSAEIKKIVPSTHEEMELWLNGYDIVQQKNKHLLESLTGTKDPGFSLSKL